MQYNRYLGPNGRLDEIPVSYKKSGSPIYRCRNITDYLMVYFTSSVHLVWCKACF